MKLSLDRKSYYRVKRGQTVSSIAAVYGCPPRVLAALNGLKEEVREGQVLLLPEKKYDLYTVRGGESKALLCGSEEKFAKKNMTKRLYPFQTVFL